MHGASNSDESWLKLSLPRICSWNASHDAPIIVGAQETVCRCRRTDHITATFSTYSSPHSNGKSTRGLQHAYLGAPFLLNGQAGSCNCTTHGQLHAPCTLSAVMSRLRPEWRQMAQQWIPLMSPTCACIHVGGLNSTLYPDDIGTYDRADLNRSPSEDGRWFLRSPATCSMRPPLG
eukprot:5045307-Amphidinium_carterae.1